MPKIGDKAPVELQRKQFAADVARLAETWGAKLTVVKPR